MLEEKLEEEEPVFEEDPRKCVKCDEHLSSQDKRGWELLLGEIKDKDGIWLCPMCIYTFTACKDLGELLKKSVEQNVAQKFVELY